ncbi:MAG: efflux RND transporter periplasmic adaptor subunit [Gammaproteobacteria bacterium]|nr:efflux RND transporter periplasmic adaptor subunit [Gammaproteobacteria bacterium]
MPPTPVFIMLLAAALALAGCGSPPAPAGGGGDMPVQAVVALVRTQALEEKLSLIGNLLPKEAVEIRSELEARITGIDFEEGQRVAAGATLLQLDASKLDAEVAEARARYQLANQDFERGRMLLERGTISVQQFDQLRTTLDANRASLRLAEERRADASIVAAFDGQMGERIVSLGQYVSKGELLTTLVQTDPLEVEFNVPERYVGQVALGQHIEIATAAYPDERFPGRVYFIAPRLDERSRTLRMKAYVDNADGRLKPGMFANLELVFRARELALVVPEAAISQHSDNTMVTVMNAEGRAELRPVEIGLRLAGLAEITRGLNAGERIVVEGYQKMAPGTRILVAPESERYGVTVEPAADAG